MIPPANRFESSDGWLQTRQSFIFSSFLYDRFALFGRIKFALESWNQKIPVELVRLSLSIRGKQVFTQSC